MKDLSFTCTFSPTNHITLEFNTIMDFTDAFEKENLSISNCSDIEATFFENPLNKKHFTSIKDLYDHCVSITK